MHSKTNKTNKELKGLPKVHSAAIAILMDKYRYLLVSIVNKYCSNESYRNDLMQASYMGLIEAYDTFNKKKNTKFSSWLYFKVNWSVQKCRNDFYLTSCSPNWRKNRPETYNTVEDNIIDTGLNPIEQLIQKEMFDEQYEYLRRIQNKLHKKLTIEERDVFLMYFIHNKKVTDIRAKYPNAYRLIEKIKEKINLIVKLDLI